MTIGSTTSPTETQSVFNAHVHISENITNNYKFRLLLQRGENKHLSMKTRYFHYFLTQTGTWFTNEVKMWLVTKCLYILFAL